MIYKKNNKYFDTAVGGTIKTDKGYITNPTEEQLKASGWKEYTAPKPTLQEVKRNKLFELEEYDKSSEVNEAYINTIPFWITREERSSLANSANAESTAGRTTTKLLSNGEVYEIPIPSFLLMIARLELYAKDCYIATATHKANIDKLTTIQEVEEYDFTKGYPQKETFKL